MEINLKKNVCKHTHTHTHTHAGDVGSIPGLERFPGKGMASHSNILAWRIPWTEEPGGLQSMEVTKDTPE